MGSRIFYKISKDLLPQLKERHPFIYLEYGRIEVDGSSIKWISAEAWVVELPIAMISAIFLGPGTTVTHEAIKILADTNCSILWMGEDCLKFYAVGSTPTADTRRLYRQLSLAMSPESRVKVVRRLYCQRFEDIDLSDKDIPEMMGMEGSRVRKIYQQKAIQYKIQWNGRAYVPGKCSESDSVNKYLTILNSFLYGIVTSSIYTLGYSPRVGFVHSGSPLPFTYDIADLYKVDTSIDLAFSIANKNRLTREQLAGLFCERIQQEKILQRIAKDIEKVLQ